jgi:hypothetical protein
MDNIRLVAFFGRLLFGSLWGLLLLIPSLALLRWRADADAGSYVLWLSIAGITAGNYVFMYVVADRLCRVKERWAVDMVEMATLVLFLVAIALTVALWLAGDLA